MSIMALVGTALFLLETGAEVRISFWLQSAQLACLMRASKTPEPFP
jgi:hypothetical protein